MRTPHASACSSLPLLSGSGRFPLLGAALMLILFGLTAIALGVSGRFLPHDERFLGMTAEQLCKLHGCRIVHFMIHDRVAFGGAVTCVGLLWLWLVNSPLRLGQAWAWWLLLLSGTVGFSSFFAFLGYGYLDTWHGLASCGLLGCFLCGVVPARGSLIHSNDIGSLLRPSVRWH
jgi:hypothetical protein